MSREIRNLAVIAAVALAAGPLGGCALFAVGGVATVATSVRQERSVGTQLDDVWIQSTLEGNYVRENGPLFRKVNTTVIEGRVYLKGEVQSDEDRREAARIAWQTPGVTEVHNDITVTNPPTLADYANDQWLVLKVRSSLLADRDVKDVNYTIEARNGVVYLMGIAQNDYERNLAVSIARGVEGVTNVVDYLVLKDDPRRGYAQAAPQPDPYATPAAGQGGVPDYVPPRPISPSRSDGPVEIRPAPPAGS
ncbi:MAG: BON domain-containing protein [Alphaproteobacteria bacterium]|nr:BON domain-containing protein [Alphaproteobacteria bacterium]